MYLSQDGEAADNYKRDSEEWGRATGKNSATVPFLVTLYSQ
jgi:hypothetical protein